NGMIISSILRKVNYDPRTSFEPICYLVTTPQIIVVNSASPYRTLAELVDAPRAKPAEPIDRQRRPQHDSAHRPRTVPTPFASQFALRALPGRRAGGERAPRRARDLRGAELVGNRGAIDRRQGPRACHHGAAADRAAAGTANGGGIRLSRFRNRRVVRPGGTSP